MYTKLYTCKLVYEFVYISKKLKGEINVRLLIALVLAVPLYNMVGFGWGILLIAGLQLLAGLDLELWKRSR